MPRKRMYLTLVLGFGLLLAVSAWALPNSKTDLRDRETVIRLPYQGSRHLDQDEMQYRYCKTTDYGHTWSEPMQAGDLSDLESWSGEMYDFGSLCDDQNNLHFMGVLSTFANPADNGVYDMHTTDGGTTWIRTLIAAAGSNEFNWASEAIDPSGNLYCLIWGTNASDHTTFWASKSTDHGMTWSAPIVLLSAPGDIHETAEYPHLAEQASANYCLFIFQDEDGGYNQYAARFPIDMSTGATVVDLQNVSGCYYSYYIGACGPIACDPIGDCVYLCYRNIDLSAVVIHHSSDQGATYSAAEEIPGSHRYPACAMDAGNMLPYIFSNVGVPQSGTYHHNWYAYDEGGYGGELWTDQIPLDSVLYDGTRDLLYVHQGYFFDDDNVISMCNVWGSFTPEGCLVNYSTNGGATWHGGWKVWDWIEDEFVGGYIEQCQLDGGTDGVAYITFCARPGITDLVPPIISNQMLVTPATELPPYVVSADYWDNTGVDWEGGIWVNWICYSHGAQWSYAGQDSHVWTDPETFSGTYYFTIPATHYDGSPVADGDTIWFYCDGYDIVGNYSSHPEQYVIAGHEWGPQYPNVGYVTLISPGPPDWGYRLHWISGCLNRLVFTNFCSGTIGSVTGDAEAAGWIVTNYGDSIVFATALPLTSGSIETFWLSHPYCSDVVTWTAGDSSGTVEGPLPVELTTFQAFAGDGQVRLRWHTASEQDNDHFVLYKCKASEDDFHVLAEIRGQGTTTEPHDYDYVDRWVQNGVTYEYQISDVDIAGHETFYEQIISATPSRDAVPLEYALHPNWPNPFNPTTTIRYDVKENGLVSLKIFDLLGREVATLADRDHTPSSYTITWDATGFPSGVYLCRMEAERFVQVRKLLLVK